MLARDADSSGEFFAILKDKPAEYENTVRLGLEQLSNGDFETNEGWQQESGPVVFQSPGHTFALPGADEGRALALNAGQLATQTLSRRVIPNATYLLEFMYRVEKPGTKVVSGVMLKGAKETLTASKLTAKPGEWAFGRLAVKTYEDTQSLTVGFEAEGGAVRIDKASLKAVRFPSANLLANSELHQIEPTFVKDIRVRYNRIPSTLRDKLMNKNHVTAYKQGQSVTAQAFTQEQSYLHNGRLDDVGQMWTYAPDNLGFSVTLTKPAFISHVVLYLNNTTPENTYSTVSILANVLEPEDTQNNEKKKSRVQGIPRLVALVRGNQKRFVIVNFPKAILTDSIKILPGKHPGKHECITEIELYGPLGGDGSSRTLSEDPLETPIFMGTPSHVRSVLPPDLVGEYQTLQNHRGAGPVFNAGAITFNGMFAFADPNGAVTSVRVPASNPRDPAPKGKPSPALDRVEDGLSWPLASVTPLGTPAHYSGRLFSGSADYKLHAVADNGAYLWGFATGGRIYSSPLPNGDDLYFGSDDGKLYNIDVDSGALIWEFKTGGRVRGAPALAENRVVVVSGDGNLYALSADGGTQLWKSPLAKNSRSTPAIKDGKVFVGDESGNAYAFELSTGKQLWKQPLAGYITQCPVVTPDGVFFASEKGEISLFSTNGSPKWKRSLNLALTGQAIATETQLVLPSESGLQVIKRQDGSSDERFKGPDKNSKVMSVQIYRHRICVTTASASTDFKVPPRTYANYSGGPAIWVPKPGAEGAK
jgi:outer membrane protein assembly factor BamB